MNHHRDSTDELRSIIADALAGAASALRQPRQPSARAEEREPVPMSSSAGGRLLLSIPEAAEILSVGRSSLYGLIQRHEIPTVKIGNRRLISIAALEHWVTDQASV